MGNQTRILEWVAISYPKDLPDSVIKPPGGMEPESLASPALAGGFFTAAPPRKPPGKTSNSFQPSEDIKGKVSTCCQNVINTSFSLANLLTGVQPCCQLCDIQLEYSNIVFFLFSVFCNYLLPMRSDIDFLFIVIMVDKINLFGKRYINHISIKGITSRIK